MSLIFKPFIRSYFTPSKKKLSNVHISKTKILPLETYKLSEIINYGNPLVIANTFVVCNHIKSGELLQNIST